MMKLLIMLLTFGVLSIVVGPVHAGADVETDTIVNGYFMDNYEGNLQYRSAGASDQNYLAIILNTGWGCSFPFDPDDMDENRIHDVLTPSGNGNQSTSGPMWHVVWPVGPGPCDPADWVAGGFGQFSSSWKERSKKNTFEGRFTASGYLDAHPALCASGFVAYSAIWHVAGKNGDPNCDLNPFAPNVSGCKKVIEKVNLECSDP